MPDQRAVTHKGGTMRLGVYPCSLVPDSIARQAYNVSVVDERHRHRFEVNNALSRGLRVRRLLADRLSPDNRLVEIMEIEDHPFMLGVQFHPEFLSRPNRPHPLFREFIDVARGTLREGGQHVLPIERPDSSISPQIL